MALFRDEAFALVVSVEELSLLLRETGSALLDARLSASDELNDDTRSQMVRAINKVSTTKIEVHYRLGFTHHLIIYASKS